MITRPGVAISSTMEQRSSVVRRCALCATPLQVGRDGRALRETVTHWHRAAWPHLRGRGTIVVVDAHTLDRQRSPPLWPLALPGRLLLLRNNFYCHYRVIQLITMIKHRHLLLSLLSCFAFFIPPPSSSCFSLDSEQCTC